MDINLAQFGTDLKDPLLAETEHLPELEQQMRRVPAGEAVVLDASGVDFIGYAWARQLLVPALQTVLAGQLPARWFALADSRQTGPARFDAASQALAENRLTVWLQVRSADRARATLHGYLEHQPPFENRRAQQKKQKQLRILQLLEQRGALYTNEVVACLQLTPPNGNYLLADLYRQRLVDRISRNHPSGGPVFLNRPAPVYARGAAEFSRLVSADP